METVSLAHYPRGLGTAAGAPTTSLSVYSYKAGEIGQRPFWVPKDHKGGRATASERRYRISPEQLPLLERRHDVSRAGSRLTKSRSLPRTPGTVSDFETECIRKLWTESEGRERLPLDRELAQRTPQSMLGKRSMTLAELETRVGLSRSGLGDRSRTDLSSRGSGATVSKGKRLTIREQRARRQELKTAKFYTALTRPMARKPQSVPIRALTQMAPPVPPLHGSPPSTDKYLHRDISIWQNEVQKVVPERPDLTVPTDFKPRHKWDFGQDYIKMPGTLFYHAKKAAPPREYMIDTEWFSEKAKPLKKGSASGFAGF